MKVGMRLPFSLCSTGGQTPEVPVPPPVLEDGSRGQGGLMLTQFPRKKRL